MLNPLTPKLNETNMSSFSKNGQKDNPINGNFNALINSKMDLKIDQARKT